MLYNPFNFQSNDNWDTDGLYWYNEFYTKKPVWTGLNQFHGLQKTGPRWSGSVPAISGSVLDWLRSMVARFWGKKPDWTRLVNTIWVWFSLSLFSVLGLDFQALHSMEFQGAVWVRFSFAVVLDGWGKDCALLGNVTGYPGVFQSNLHLYPSKPIPASTGMGFHGYR